MGVEWTGNRANNPNPDTDDKLTLEFGEKLTEWIEKNYPKIDVVVYFAGNQRAGMLTTYKDIRDVIGLTKEVLKQHFEEAAGAN